MTNYAFNGFLFSQRPTGVMRYAYEMLLELDKIEDSINYELVVPIYAKNIPSLKNIRVVKYGSIKGNLWEQTSYVAYLKKHNRCSVNFNNTIPFLAPGIIIIHDLAYKIHPEYFDSLHGKLSILYHRLVFRFAAKSKFPILTDTYYSRDQLINIYGIAPERLKVIGCGWQHMKRIEPSNTIIEKLGLSDKQYYFTLGSVSKMKNTEWVLNVAKQNVDNLFVITGAVPENENDKYTKSNNVIFTGFLSDGEIKTLISHCKAFIYASKFDGFGIPPIEALSQGAEVICTNAACLPEVYGSSVRYIDPYDTNVDLEELLKHKVYGVAEVLEKYDWAKTAKSFNEVLKSYSRIQVKS